MILDSLQTLTALFQMPENPIADFLNVFLQEDPSWSITTCAFSSELHPVDQPAPYIY